MSGQLSQPQNIEIKINQRIKLNYKSGEEKKTKAASEGNCPAVQL